MCIAPTEPLGYAAAELALELYKVFTMFGAVLNRYVAAVRADKLLRVKVTPCLGLVHSCHAVFSATEVRVFALKALEVSVDSHSVLFGLSVVRRAFFF